MDNRWRFLYCMPPELRGRMWGAASREGEARHKRRSGAQGKTGAQRKSREVDRKGVGKSRYHVPRKAAMARYTPVPKTDTGGWGENPKADGRSIVKELGKMTP